MAILKLELARTILLSFVATLLGSAGCMSIQGSEQTDEAHSDDQYHYLVASMELLDLRRVGTVDLHVKVTITNRSKSQVATLYNPFMRHDKPTPATVEAIDQNGVRISAAFPVATKQASNEDWVTIPPGSSLTGVTRIELVPSPTDAALDFKFRVRVIFDDRLCLRYPADQKSLLAANTALSTPPTVRDIRCSTDWLNVR